MSDRFWNRLEFEKEVEMAESKNSAIINVERVDYIKLLRAAMDYHDQKYHVGKENKALLAERDRMGEALKIIAATTAHLR